MNSGSKKKFLVAFTLLTSLSVFLVMSSVCLHGLGYITLSHGIIFIFLFYSLLALASLVWLVLRATSWYDSKLSGIVENHAEEIAAIRSQEEKSAD